MKRTTGILCAFSLVLLMTSVSAFSQLTHYTNITAPVIQPMAVNKASATAGFYCCGLGPGNTAVYSGFLRTGGGQFRAIVPTGASSSFAAGINSKAIVVGGYCVAPLGCSQLVGQHGYQFQGFSFPGTFRTIDYPGAVSTVAGGINSTNQVVGTYCDQTLTCLAIGGDHGFLDDNGTFSAIDFPGATKTGANAINDSGQIVGVYSAQSHFRGYLLSGGVYTTINPSGATYSNAEGINNLREIVGTYLDASNQQHGFMYNAGVYTTIDRPGASSTSADGVNDAGTVVGMSVISGVSVGYSAKP